jgi:hypothetical protein
MRSTAYQELWGVVDGAVVDAFNNHPDYLTQKGHKSARTSVVKRVTGTVLSFAAQAARGRSYQPAETSDGVPFSHPAGEGVSSVLPNPHCRIGKITLKRQVSSRRSMPFNETLNMLRRSLSAPRPLIQGEEAK